jgi:hypothetical protein
VTTYVVDVVGFTVCVAPLILPGCQEYRYEPFEELTLSVADEPEHMPGLLGEEAVIGVDGVTVAAAGTRKGFSQGPDMTLSKKKNQ